MVEQRGTTSDTGLAGLTRPAAGSRSGCVRLEAGRSGGVVVAVAGGESAFDDAFDA